MLSSIHFLKIVVEIFSLNDYNASLLSKIFIKEGWSIKMNLYQELQLNQAMSKQVIRNAVSLKEKAHHIGIYFFKVILTMVFCVGFVTAYAKLFGDENSIVGVVVLLCVMGFRFVNTGLRTVHGIGAMCLIFLILAFGPRLANCGGLGFQLLTNVVCIFLLMILGCHNVIFFNQSTLVLGYLLLFGYDVVGEAYKMRLWAIFVGAILTIVVYYRNHRKKNYKRNIIDLLKEFRITSTRGKWQIAITIGCALMIFMASLLGFERPMWAGIATMSVIQPFHEDIKHRVSGRIWGNSIGSIIFIILYHVIPEKLYFTFGIIGGIGVGFSASYGWQAVFNSLGAMMIASEFLGMQGAIYYRILNNICGSLFGYLFFTFISHVIHKKYYT